MRILLVNVPHPAIGSRVPDDHLPPLGLLSIGGPLLDDGHEVRLLDADRTDMAPAAIVADAVDWRPEAVLFGHSGSTSGHPIIAGVARAIHERMPEAAIVYGGVYPTYHWREVLTQEPYVTAIVRGEGEETVRRLIAALERDAPLADIPGLAFRDPYGPRATRPAPAIRDLDAHRIGWELIDFEHYGYWGGLRGVVVQFSRGCPHLCSYCGQRGFWTRWRHRDPKLFARELAWLYREHGVRVVNFADENPTASRMAWKAFLEALIAENVDLVLVGSTRAADIVRDADILHLYKQAGCQRFLLGMESTDAATLELIRKGTTTAEDRQAIGLLRRHGILSLATWVMGFEEETDADLWRGLRQLLAYDPDQVTLMYVTPHRWTPYYTLAAGRRVIQPDRTKWDYKHQVLATRHMPPWRTFLWMKLTELVLQGRPKALRRTFFHPRPELRHPMRWYAKMGRRVWLREVWGFLRGSLLVSGPSVAEFWGEPQEGEEQAMDPRRPPRQRATDFAPRSRPPARTAAE